MDTPRTLPDYLRPGLTLVFVGINPSVYSAQRGRYFARPTNRFWRAFSHSRLSAAARQALAVEALEPEHDAALLDFGIGFTDVVKRPGANAASVSQAQFREGALLLRERLEAHRPTIAVFHGLTAYRPFARYALGLPTRGAALGPQPERLSDTVKNTWIIMHVTVVFLAYAGFIMGAVFAALYLIQQRQLKKRHVNVFFRRLPSLEVLDDWSSKAVSFGLPFMTMTIITGMIRAVKEFPNWYIDPIVTTTTLTWTIFALYLGLRYLWDWQGRRIAYVAIIGLMSIVLIQVTRYFPVFHQFG